MARELKKPEKAYTAADAVKVINGKKRTGDDVQFHVRMNADLKALLDQAAADNDMTVVAYARQLIKRGLRAEGYL